MALTHTILGAGGAIGLPLARELSTYSHTVRLAGRNPSKVTGNEELCVGDLRQPETIEKAVAGSSVVYLTVGFEYNARIWKEYWPPFLATVLEACRRHEAKLVFFDNVYAYARESIPCMTESSPIDPPSEKGKVRALLHRMIMENVEKGHVQALIARGADFYGPENRNSALKIMVIDPLRKGKKPQVFGNPDKIHTYTFTPDAARATALLGNTSDAFNQVWHLPTTKELLTNRDWIELISDYLNQKKPLLKTPTWLLPLIGLMVPVLKEFPEMMYQFDQDYVFDSSKFEKRFGMGATPPPEGIRATLNEAPLA